MRGATIPVHTMGHRYTVLGCGRQGVALAYDLAKNGDADSVVLADSNEIAAKGAARRLTELVGTGVGFEPVACDVREPDSIVRAIEGSAVVASCVPYRHNPLVARHAVATGVSFLDQGGNTSVGREELAMHEQAAEQGVSIVPDCGLAPGLANHLAAHGMATIDEPEHVHVRCGGLPQTPVGPLGYKMLFHFEGLANEYSGYGEYLRDGQPVRVPTLSELETEEFDGYGTLEADVTSGGTSTCAETWRGRLQSYDYKTLRYPGHWNVIRALFALDAFEPEIQTRTGETLHPRAMTRALFERKLDFPEVPDVVLLRVRMTGRHAGQPITRVYDVTREFDEATGFTAMESGTASPAALVAHFQARGLVEPGARPLEVCVPPVQFFEELPAHGIQVRVTETPG